MGLLVVDVPLPQCTPASADAKEQVRVHLLEEATLKGGHRARAH